MNHLEITFLGTGTSTGIPEIGCRCDVCTSDDSRDQRLRTSIWIKTAEESLIIDTAPDLRQQCLRAQIPNVTGVLFTHLHADHFFGLDDLRRYNMIQKNNIDAYLPYFMEENFRQVFGYTLRPAPKGVTVPEISLKLIDTETIPFKDLAIKPLKIWHGSEEIRAYSILFGNKKIVYMTDCKVIPDETLKEIMNCDLFIVGAIWRNRHKHVKHFDLEDALNMAEQIQAKEVYLTHFSHLMEQHAVFSSGLPQHVSAAYDNLKLKFSC